MAETKKSGVLEEYWLSNKLFVRPRGKVNMVKNGLYVIFQCLTKIAKILRFWINMQQERTVAESFGWFTFTKTHLYFI